MFREFGYGDDICIQNLKLFLRVYHKIVNVMPIYENPVSKQNRMTSCAWLNLVTQLLNKVDPVKSNLRSEVTDKVHVNQSHLIRAVTGVLGTDYENTLTDSFG